MRHPGGLRISSSQPGHAGINLRKSKSSMKNKYSDDLTILLTRSYPELGAAYKLEFKNLFGAVAGYVDGQIFISCGRFGVALKLPAQTLNGLFAMRDV